MGTQVEQALQLIREGRSESVEQALALLQNTVYSFSMKVCGHREDAEDTMQDVLLKSIPHLAKFDNPKALKVWLYRVTQNHCISRHRGMKAARSRHLSLDELMPNNHELSELLESDEPSPESKVLSAERAEHLRQAVLDTPPQYRIVLVLHDMEGLNTAEVAQVTGLREGTVRVRLHRGRLFVRRRLAELAKHAGAAKAARGAAPQPMPARSPRCRKLFAALSDFMDGVVDDAVCDEMDRHIGDCQPCQAFLSSLKDIVEQCKSYAPPCDSHRSAELRSKLVQQYRAAVSALSPERSIVLH